MRHLKLFENNRVDRIKDIDEQYQILKLKIRKYLIFNNDFGFQSDYYLKSFDIGEDSIEVYYKTFGADKIARINLQDFSLFFENEEEYKKNYKLRKETDKYNL